MKKKIILGVCLVVVLLAGALFFLIKEEDGEKVDYRWFYEQLEKENIEKVLVDSDDISFWLRGDEKRYLTENPKKINLKEELLLAGVTVEETMNATEVLSEILDWFTTLFLIGIVVLAGVKFLQPFEFKTAKRTGNGFKDVIGLEELKQETLQLVELLKYPSKLKDSGTRQPKGVILSGSPGNGKTLFARALADEAGINFIPTRATDFESMFMAVGPAKVKKLFRYAKRKAPCIIFIDEFDGIGTRRSYSGSGIETENVRIVTALLNEMDGFSQKERIMVLAATNNPKALDAALIRPGRFDKHFTVGIPKFEERKQLIEFYTKNKKLADDFPMEELAEWTKGKSCAAIETLLNEAALLAERKNQDAIDRKIIIEMLKKRDEEKE